MHKKSIWVSFLLFLITFGTHAAPLNPTGYWKNIDDVTGKPQAILEITESSSHRLTGRIVKTFPRAGEEPLKRCQACSGARHNQPILGMIIMENLKQLSPLEWSGGYILDPKSGKTYHCNLTVIENGEKLSVRGYIGLPLFGRSQVWLRTDAI